MKSQPRAASSREALLQRAVDYAAENGLSDVSLRQMAAALGTSHRMLIYHFGSKEGVLVAVIHEMERRQLEHLAALDADPSLPAGELLRRMWRHLSARNLWPHERLFFEVYGQALQGRPRTLGLLDDIVESWLAPVAAMGERDGLSRRAARARARLGLAVVRGLLLDLLATGDRRSCDDAMEAFIASLPAAAV